MPRHKYLLAIICTLLCSVCTLAQSSEQTESARTIVNVINDSDKGIAIIQPTAINNLLMHKNASFNPGSDSRSKSNIGYRVEVYSDNNVHNAKAVAQSRKSAIEERFGVATYLTFRSPYWTLRAGNFRTYHDADVFLSEIKAAFPKYANDLRVVRERVNITD